ncbi:transcription factor-related [Melia azedarach]|uniref:Transcription factor-related n=1 Tax=Melia azedarach TaxID=155640 RepID=A0ACC1WRQ4_MELAZ|nr:transcription factor-related [Melia azedarach]
MAHPTERNIRVNFETFFGEWLNRQQNYLDQLHLEITPEHVDKYEQHLSLIDQVLSHYQQYYGEKSVAAREDVILFFSPPWFTSFERTLLWIGGFRPTLVFKLINHSVHDLTAEQERVLDRLKAETRKGEKELAETMARIQESLASPPSMNLARRGNLIDGEALELDSAMKDLQTGMLAALEAADALRGTTVRKVLHVLHPVQTVKLLTAAAQFHLRIRRWGLQRDELGTAATNGL